MNADELLRELFGMMEGWAALTHAEMKSIREDDWEGLDRFQREKGELQESIQRLEREIFEGEALDPIRRAEERARLRQVAAELRELEVQNRDLLLRRLGEMDERLKRMGRTIKELKRIHEAYTISARSSFWQQSS